MTVLNKEKLWTKDFIFASVVNFALMLSMYLLLVTMATYSIQEYGATVSMAGLAASIFVIGSLVGRLIGGRQIAKAGSKKILMTGTVLVLIFTVLYFIPAGLYPLLLLRFLHGVGLGLATTATGTIVAQVIPPSRNGEGIGYFSMSVVMATAIGPLIGVLMVSSMGFISIFIFSTVMSVVSLLLSLALRAPVVKIPEEAGEQKGIRLSDFYEARAVPVSIAMFVLAFAYSGILSFVTGYAAEINLVEAGSFFFLAYGVSILLSRPITGPLMDRKGANIVVYPALSLFAIGMLLLSVAPSSWIFLLAAVLIGLGYGNFQSITQALAIKVTPPHRMGLANSTYFIALDLGLGVGPFILGYIVPLSGYKGMYTALVGVILAGIVVYHLVHGRKDRALLQKTNG